MKMKCKDVLFHYTSMEVLFKLFEYVKSPQDPIKLWVSRADFMNDLYENNWLFELMIGLQTRKEPQYEETVSKILTEKHLQRIGSSIPFVASFTDEHDSLPMWNMYGDKGKGAVIGFNSTKLGELEGWESEKCDYLERDVFQKSQLYQDYMALYEKHDSSGNPELNGLFMLLKDDRQNTEESASIRQLRKELMKKNIVSKHPGFKLENEYRLISRGNKNEKYRLRNGNIIPYVELEIPASAVEQIFIGPVVARPTRTMELLKSFLRGKVKDNPHLILHQSDIPYTAE